MSVRVRIQMIGTQRSGSNLLRLMLAQLPEVFAPPSAHIVRDFEALLDRYEPLTCAENLAGLVGGIRQVIEANALPWPNGPPPLDAVLAACQGPTLEQVFCAVYDAAASAAGATCWISKSLENVHRVPSLARLVPGLGVIHQLRDPRDVALSFAAAPIGPKVPEVAAQRWVDDQRAAARHRNQVPADRWVAVRYEDLVGDPETTIRRVCQVFGMQYTQDTLSFYARSEAGYAQRLSSLWSNLGRPIDAASVGRFHDPEVADFVRRVETVAFDIMAGAGYRPIYATGQRVLSDQEWDDALATDAAARRATAARANPCLEVLHRERDRVLSALRRAAPASCAAGTGGTS